MGSFVLSCESTADYPRSFFEARGIEYIMFHYELDGVVHERTTCTNLSRPKRSSVRSKRVRPQRPRR